MTDKERKMIVYVDENEEEMRYEEYNENGELKVKFYDEELESVQEFIHNVKVKSLQSVQNTKAIEKESDYKEMNDYEKLIELRDRISEDDFGYAEDVQLLDRVLDYMENQKITEFTIENEKEEL